MKEFTSQTGGRHTYIDDILNLQDLALAFASIFNECENFIISGCQVSDTTISPVYVYINGKIRYCAGTTGATKWPMYVYESNHTEKVSYADSNDKIGRNIYGCTIASSVPTTNDALTGVAPQAISIAEDGTTVRLKEALFGKYALMVDSPYSSQTVKNNVVVGGDLTTNKSMTAKTGMYLKTGTAIASAIYDTSGNLTIQSALTGKSALKMVLSEAGAFQFYKGNTMLLSIDGSGTTIKVSSNFPSVKGGNIMVQDNHIYNTGVALDRGAININMLGYNGGKTYFRNTVIGNGKNEAIVTFNGELKTSTYNGAITIATALESPFTIKYSTLAKTDKTLLSYVGWKDKNDAVMAQLGFTDNTNYDYYIINKIGNVRISSDTYIAGKLYVNGVEVMGTLVSTTTFNAALEKKANSADVYSKTKSDERYVKLTDSISVFVTQAGGGETGQKAVCKAIGAATATSMSDVVLKSQLFADIVSDGMPDASDNTYVAKLTERKRSLCEAIGAAYKDDVATAVKDTGWIAMDVKNCGIVTKIYVRQVGAVVSIQGELHTHHSGTIFTLPNTVDPPKYKIGYSHNKYGTWHCVMEGGSRDCVVDECNSGCSEYIGFLITYII